MPSYRGHWIALLLVIGVSFAVLGAWGPCIGKVAPPISERVLAAAYAALVGERQAALRERLTGEVRKNTFDARCGSPPSAPPRSTRTPLCSPMSGALCPPALTRGSREAQPRAGSLRPGMFRGGGRVDLTEGSGRAKVPGTEVG